MGRQARTLARRHARPHARTQAGRQARWGDIAHSVLAVEGVQASTSGDVELQESVSHVGKRRTEAGLSRIEATSSSRPQHVMAVSPAQQQDRKTHTEYTLNLYKSKRAWTSHTSFYVKKPCRILNKTFLPPEKDCELHSNGISCRNFILTTFGVQCWCTFNQVSA